MGGRAAERALLNAYGGVATGEHPRQLLTAMFVGQLAALLWDEPARVTAGIGFITTLTLVFGTGEGRALSLGADGSGFGLIKIAGFVGLIINGIGLIRK